MKVPRELCELVAKAKCRLIIPDNQVLITKLIDCINQLAKQCCMVDINRLHFFLQTVF